MSYLHADSIGNGTVTDAIHKQAIEPNYLTTIESNFETKFFVVNDDIGYQAVNLTSPTPRARDTMKAAAYDELIFKEKAQLYPFVLFYFKP